MREDTCVENRNAMLDYLIFLLDNSNDFSWTSAKACHAVLLCQIEQSEIQNYTQVDRIGRIRRARAQRHGPISGQNVSKSHTKHDRSTNTMVCQFFNQGSCLHQSTHEIKGTLYSHVYNYCFTKKTKPFNMQR